jgi:hypothetical protein
VFQTYLPLYEWPIGKVRIALWQNDISPSILSQFIMENYTAINMPFELTSFGLFERQMGVFFHKQELWLLIIRIYQVKFASVLDYIQFFIWTGSLLISGKDIADILYG